MRRSRVCVDGLPRRWQRRRRRRGRLPSSVRRSDDHNDDERFDSAELRRRRACTQAHGRDCACTWSARYGDGDGGRGVRAAIDEPRERLQRVARHMVAYSLALGHAPGEVIHAVRLELATVGRLDAVQAEPEL